MDPILRQKIIRILEEAKDMTIATIREDGYPQATTVSYVSDGLTVYFGCGDHSQKARNIARDARVSFTVNLPYATWDEILGLSAGGTAGRVSDPREIEKAGQLMVRKFPQVAQYATTGMEGLALFRVAPVIFSVLDYRKGFGHADLVGA